MLAVVFVRRTALVLACLAATPLAEAGGVRIVDPLGQHNFADIQSAVDAAQDGDVLLVGAGTYPGFEIAAKALSVFGVPAGGLGVTIAGNVEIEDLAAGTVVVSGLAARRLRVAQCAGHVAIQDCSFVSPPGGFGSSSASCSSRAASPPGTGP